MTSTEPDSDNQNTTGFSGAVIAIGASAGGLEALERFFDQMPGDTGACFVVIQHLSPDHKSMMSRLLERHTNISTSEVNDGDTLRPNHIFLIPPAAMMHLEGDQLRLTPKRQHGLNLPIDAFFHSIATNLGNRATGVILSGTGSDGTRGAVAINEAGGFLLAQEPDTAKFDSMPQNAMATGLVDAVLPPDDMAKELMALLNHPWEGNQHRPVDENAPVDHFKTLMESLQAATGIDFSEYKEATVNRRIERRMQVRHIGSLADYQALVGRDEQEALALRRELLIGVTRFFRDTDAFHALSQQAIIPLVKRSQSDDTLRIWAAGVSTGEEVYSLAMLFIETFESLRRWPTLKIFATDVNQHHLEIASQGQYPESATAELSPQRVERFLSRVNDSFVVKKELRQCIVFANHNLLTDPPFTNMDLVVCRNTLIYFKSSAQSRALSRLQYGLRQGGYLFLGSSESLASEQKEFNTLDSKNNLFQLVEQSTRRGDMGSYRGGQRGGRAASRAPSELQDPATKEQSSAITSSLDTLVRQYVPPSILLNDHQELCHVFGDAQHLLHIREGWASLSLKRIMPERLGAIAVALFHTCLRKDHRTSSDYIHHTLPDEQQEVVRLSAAPVADQAGHRHVLLSFEIRPLSQEGAKGTHDHMTEDLGPEQLARVDRLERELVATQDSLQATIEELETTNEELQATNEELMASNEELQSANEELQSVNEELNTVNAESEERIDVLNQLNADLDTMAKANGVPTVFVDEALLLTRFSPDATDLFSLRSSDTGRRLDDFSHQLLHEYLVDDIEHTLRSGKMTEKEVESRRGAIYLMRILPYETDHGTRGAVASFVNITAYRNAERLQAILDGLPERVAVLNTDGTIVLVNEPWRDFADVSGDPDFTDCQPGTNYLAVTENAQATSARKGDIRSSGVRAVLSGEVPRYSEHYTGQGPDGVHQYLITISPLHGFGYGAVVSHIDITALHQSTQGHSADSST